MTDQQPVAGDKLVEIWACVWRAGKDDETFDPSEFQSRIPRLMQWLASLRASGNLVACGGGSWENHSGGLTLLRADSYEHAKELSDGTPMNEIGTTEIMVWDVYFADLNVAREFAK